VLCRGVHSGAQPGDQVDPLSGWFNVIPFDPKDDDLIPVSYEWRIRVICGFTESGAVEFVRPPVSVAGHHHGTEPLPSGQLHPAG